MNCPSCNEQEIRREVTLKGSWKKTKVITYYCAFCPFKNAHEFELSREDFELEKLKKETLINALPMKIYNKKTNPPQGE